MSSAPVNKWLGTYPGEWQCPKIGALGTNVSVKNIGLIETNLLSLSYGRVKRKDINSGEGLLPASFETYQIVEPGDIVFRFTDLQNDKRSLRSALVTETGIITSAYIAYRPNPDVVNSTYFNYLMRALDLRKAFYEMGSGVRQTLKFEELATVVVPLPPLDTQRAIADYLDRETGEIDAMLGKLDGLVPLLEERKRNLVRELLDAAEYTTVGLGFVATVTNGSTPKRDEPRYWSDSQGTYWLNSSVVNQESVTEGKFWVTNQALRECHLPRVKPGDVLVGITGQGKTRGMSTLCQVDATISQHLAAIAPGASLRSRFLLHVLVANYEHLRRDSEGAGSTKGAITLDQILRLRIPLAPLDEQERIESELDEATARIDAMLRKVGALRTLLSERRSALITAAVTGQIEV